MTRVDLEGTLARARAHGLKTERLELAGFEDQAGVLHSERGCRIREGSASEQGNRSLAVQRCSRCAHRARVLEDGEPTQYNVVTFEAFLLGGLAHLEVAAVLDADVVSALEEGVESRWGVAPYLRERLTCEGEDLRAWEVLVQEAQRARRDDLLRRAGTELFDELKLAAARDVLAVPESHLARFKRTEDKLEALAQELAEDTREFLVVLGGNWRTHWWGAEVLRVHRRVPSRRGEVLRVPVVVLARLEKAGVVLEAAALGRTSDAELEALGALYDPGASSEVKTLKGALRVARAL
jgi:hypothetical protein